MDWVPICTRKTTVKTNTITISSKPLPPCPQPTPPVTKYEANVEISEGELSKVAQQEGGGLATHGGGGRDRPRLRVQLPPPPIRSPLKAQENPTLEFVIHAGDVIPSEAPPRTLGGPIGWESGRHMENVDPVRLRGKENENVSAPVTLMVAEETDWPGHFLDPFSQLQVCDSQNLGKALSKPSLPEGPSLIFDSGHPISMQNPQFSSAVEQNRLAVKRKPAPPVRVYSLPITPTESNNDNSYYTASMATHLQNFFSPDASEMILPRTGPESSWNFLDPNMHGGTMLAPRSHSSPPASANPHDDLNTAFAPPSPSQRHINVEGPAEIHWRTLSSLDLTSDDELNIYLGSLSALAGTPMYPTASPLRVSTSSSHYSDDSTFPNARISRCSNYSYDSNLPSPSGYMVYPSPQSKCSLVPRSQMGAVELPGTSAVLLSSNLRPQSNKRFMVNVGQLRLPSSSYNQPRTKTLQVLLTAPSRFPVQEQDMPCRTTILKGSRRVTFIRRGASQGMTPINNSSYSGSLGTHLPPSAISINTALKLGSGKGLLNRENSRRIRERGGSILRRRGRDVYLELVNFGYLVGEPCYEVFLNRLDGSVWFVLNSGTSVSGSLAMGVFDQWFSNLVPRKQPTRERVVAVRWADGLDCVDGLRGSSAGSELKGTLVTRQCTTGEMEVECPQLVAAGLEGVEVYLGEAVDEEEGGWFMPEGW